MKLNFEKQLQVNERWIVYGTLLVCFVLFFTISWFSQGTYGGGDDFMHHQIARYAFQHPEKFLYHWGKPFYTLLISPFAQFGYFGSKLFNLIIGIITAFLCYRIGKHFEYRRSFLLPIFVLFTPVYTSMLISGMTEILFSFILVISVFLFLKKQPIFSAIVLSFLPFVRNEGIVILPIFLALFIIYRNYKAVPFLLLGYIIYSIVGFFVFNDLNWVINKMPYGDASSLYGSGTLFHYVERTKIINGLPLGIMFVIGLIVIVYSSLKDKISPQSNRFKELAIVLLPALAYYVAHSYVWWQGKGASLGLIRVMAAVAPLMAIVSFKGLEFLADLIKRYRWVVVCFYSALVFIVLVTPFRVYKFPVPISRREKLIAEASTWLKHSEFFERRILYYDPYVAQVAGFDPFDKLRSRMPYGHSIDGDVRFDDNDVIVWDAQFGPNEGRMPREKLIESPYLQLVKVFKPEIPFSVFRGYNYEILIFISNKDSISHKNQELYNQFLKEFDDEWKKECLTYLSFESNDSLGFYRISESEEYSLTQVYSFDTVYSANYKELKIKASANVLIPNLNSETSLRLSAALEVNGKILHFWSVGTKELNFNANQWKPLDLEFTVPNVKKKNAVIKVFLWNISHKEFYVKDFTIVKRSKENK